MTRLFTLIALIFVFALGGIPAARAQEHHEYAPLEEKAINYKDWTFNNLTHGTPVNLRQWAKNKKLVLVVYFAPWCPNWRYEAPVVARLYEKYKANGFDVVAINEYGTRDEVKAFFGEKGAPYLVVVESEKKEERDKTSHYNYRQASGDKRKWGSPYNIFLEPSKLAKTGDLVMEKAWIVNGELIEADTERFIRARLGLGLTAKTVTPCEP
jgi:thiol-disulfide isomerase/thioredoxin